MPSRRSFVRQSLLATAAAIAPTRDAIGAIPGWWSNPSRDPATGLQDAPDRLPIAWYRATIGQLQAALAAAGLDGLLCKDQWNIVYLSGYFHSQTSGPKHCGSRSRVIRRCSSRDSTATSVASWWIKDAEYYFDYPHAETNNDPRAASVVGPTGTVDLWKWMAQGLGRRGYAAKTIGLDWDAPESTLKKLRDVLPQAKFRVASDLTMQMRIIKSPEEVAITQRAIDYSDQMLEFCRRYVLEHGTDATDFDVRHAAEAFGAGLVMKDLKRDGRPHTAVGVSFSVGCRTGVGTAYPHPNQFFHAKIQKGDALQFSGIMVRIGGYGGEGYRACHVQPMTDAQRRMWEVHTEMTLAQQEFSHAGVPCREVASKVHEIARKAGLERYLYHRPAHGAGMEGHQQPYISLATGDPGRWDDVFKRAGLVRFLGATATITPTTW